MEASNKTLKVHIGRKVGRLREIRGIKQEAIAQELGVTQQAVSKLEQSEFIEDEVLEKIAKVLGVTSDAIKNFNEEAIVNIIVNSFSDFKDNASGINYNCDLNFNPIDKLVELYERLLQSEREKIEILKGNK